MNCNRRSIRLKEYDYAQSGAYFVTICVQDRQCLFGNIQNGNMQLNEIGQKIQEIWEKLPGHFPNIGVDEFVVMPNHIHGIIVIKNFGVRAGIIPPHKGRANRAPTLGNIVAYFKYQTTKITGYLRPHLRLWQRNYYEHIIRNDEDLIAIRRYIAMNPLKWAEDVENPDVMV